MPGFFNSRDLQYKAPFGAVAVGTPVTLKVCMPREWGCTGVTLLVDRDGLPPEQVEMAWFGMQGETHEWWAVTYTPADAGLYWYGFYLKVAMGGGYLVRREDGTALYSPDRDGTRWQLTCYEQDFTTPDWLAGGVLYQIFPDRFANSGKPKTGVPTDRVIHANWDEQPEWRPDAQGRVWNNDFFGGDLEGIRQKLDYLQSLGVTCIYLNPIFESHSNHRYDTADYTHVDPLLGDEEDLRRLTAEAKERGIRVMLDGVFSHTGSDSIYFNRERRYPGDGAYNSPHSPYTAWYHFRSWPNEYGSWWGFDTLPEVEELSPAFMEYINGEEGIVSRWLKAGASGWRLDVADELPDGFLDALRKRVKATDPDAMVLGEVWEDATNKESYGHRRRYLLGQQLDSVMNYPFRDAVLGFLLGETGEDFINKVWNVVENYPPQTLRLLMNHIGTHDTERALTLLGGDAMCGRGRPWQASQRMTPDQRSLAVRRMRLASLLQYALPGVPCVYYGDEAGLEGYKDPFNRGTYPWGREDTALVDWYRQLGQVRGCQPVLAEGAFEPMPWSGDLVGFVRRDAKGALLCVANRGYREQVIRLPGGFLEGEILVGDGTVQNGYLVLPPLSGVWMAPEPPCAE